MTRGTQIRVSRLEARATDGRAGESGALIFMRAGETEAEAEARHYAEHPADRLKPFAIKVCFVEARDGRPI
jgi:hypothetical protein